MPPEALAVVFVSGLDGSVTGTVSAVRLIQSPRDARSCRTSPPAKSGTSTRTGTSGAVVRKMSDYNLTAAPVLDPDHGRILGVITVDDVLELPAPDRISARLRRDGGGGVTVVRRRRPPPPARP